MSKQRIIKDEVWDDEWFYDLDPIEKLLWLFLLTNSRCNIAGIYKLNIKWAARMTGLDNDMFPKVIERFVKDKKIFLHDEWVVIINFTRHQSENPSVKTGINRVLEDVPGEVIDSLRQAVPACPTLLYLTLLNSTSPTEGEPVGKKEKYGESGSVHLTIDEYQKLCDLLTKEAADSLIEELDDYLGSSGKRYKSHYKTLRNWARRKIQNHKSKNQPQTKRIVV